MIFKHSIESEGVRFTAEADTGRAIPPSQWIAAGQGAARSAAVLLMTRVDSGQAFLLHDSVSLPHERAVELSEHEAKALSLPDRGPFSLHVEHKGSLSGADFTIFWSLRHRTGAPVIHPQHLGGFVRIGRTWHRLPETFFRLIEACSKINDSLKNSDLAERMRAYASLREFLPDSPEEGVSTSSLLRQFQVYDAGAFSLKMQITRGKLRFEPVLYGRKPARSGDDFGEPETDEPEALLTDAAQEEFVRLLNENTPRYALGGHRHLVLSPHLTRALNTVKRLRDSDDPEAQRRLFLNPTEVLREQFAQDLGEGDLDEVLSSLFLETKAYLADRVIGIGIWQKPVLPWIQKRSNDWFPPEDDSFPAHAGLRIETENGTVDLALDKKAAEELKCEVEQAVAEGRDFVEHDGQRLPATAETLSALDSLLNAREKLPRDPTTTFALLIEGNYEEVGCGTSLTARASLSAATVPACLRTPLKDHQIHGIRWLRDAWHQGMPGVLLADDMGLGKTLQALAFLAWLRENTRQDPGPNEGGILIVAPTALLRNWKAEAEKHLEAPGLGEVLEVHGSSLRRLRNASGQGLNVDILRRADWLLTTYETLQGYQTDFGSIRFRCLVLDEAQKVKSPDTQVTSAIKAVNAGFKIAMTGTPVENRRADLWCVSDTVYPGLLGSLKEFSQAYEKDESPEAAGRLHGLITRNEGNDRTPQPFMLRRMKQDILDGLPSKNSETSLEEMPSPQAQRYREVLDSARGTAPGAKLMAIQDLRTVSLHPWLADDNHDSERDFNTGHFVSSSARMQALVKILHSVQSVGEKALLFVNSRRMQQWLRVFAADTYGLTEVMLINGETPGAQRQAAVDRFQASPPGFDLMLLSPRAAGVGLTITAANHVIHLERWWNPAVEDQCTDRVYRIGQEKTVTVWLPQAVHPSAGIRDHSFDLRIHALLENKRRLSRELLAPIANSDKDTAQLFDEIVDSVV